MIEPRASYDVENITLHPLADRVLVRVLEEPTGLLLPSYTKGEGRSMQGQIVAIGIRAIVRDGWDPVPGMVVLFDDSDDTRWWKGGLLPNYLGAVVDEGDEYIILPRDALLAEVVE